MAIKDFENMVLEQSYLEIIRIICEKNKL